MALAAPPRGLSGMVMLVMLVMVMVLVNVQNVEGKVLFEAAFQGRSTAV